MSKSRYWAPHDYSSTYHECPHYRCGERSGYLCQVCFHYFPRNLVAVATTNTVTFRCRNGKGHNSPSRSGLIRAEEVLRARRSELLQEAYAEARKVTWQNRLHP